MNIEALWVGRMDVQMGWDGMVIIGRRLSKSTLGANKGQLKIPKGVFLSLAVFLHRIMTTHNAACRVILGCYVQYHIIRFICPSLQFRRNGTTFYERGLLLGP